MVKTKYALIINPDAEVHIEMQLIIFFNCQKKKDFAIIAPFIQEKNQNNEVKLKNGMIEVKNVKGFYVFKFRSI